MREAVIASSIRTAVGKASKGTLAATRPDDLAAIVIREAIARVPGLEAREVDDVILGCAMPEGEQGMNLARIASLRAGLPVEVSAMTINRFCSSGLQAIAIAAERVAAGGADVMVAAGGRIHEHGAHGWQQSLAESLADGKLFRTPTSLWGSRPKTSRENIPSRANRRPLSYESHRKALAAIAGGNFKDEIVPVEVHRPSFRECSGREWRRSQAEGHHFHDHV